MSSFAPTKEGRKKMVSKNILLSGGPPWGFNLAGGIELGCPLFIKKVTDASRFLNEPLLDGDEILGVNNNKVRSRKDAIEMIRSSPDNHLVLEIQRNADLEHDGNQTNPMTRMYTASLDRGMKKTLGMQRNQDNRHFSETSMKDEEDHSMPNVSSARAMFERMTSSGSNPDKIKQKDYSNNKNASSSTVPVSEMNTPLHEFKTLHSGINIRHQQSRSLPIEMAGLEFQKAVATYKHHRINTKKGLQSYSQELGKAFDYSKSSGQFSEENNNILEKKAQDTQTQSENKEQRLSISNQYNKKNNIKALHSRSSHSYEDLTSLSHESQTRSAANELREAASRYHEELMKNYPKFRKSLASMESVQGKKFPRKTSMPPEDAFTRGEPYRATIATATSTRVPRSFSSNDSELRSLESPLDYNDESILTKLLRSSEHNTLNKIDEEARFNMTRKEIYEPPVPEKSSVEETNQSNNVNEMAFHNAHKVIDRNKNQVEEQTHSHREEIGGYDETIFHKKEASSDSAVYVCEKETPTILNTSDEISPPENGKYFSPSLNVASTEDNSKDNDKEKPQRTINRRKKDSNLSSRNDSCVSTDSTTSTATVDSGIVLLTDVSPRVSPQLLHDNVEGSPDSHLNSLWNDQRHVSSTPEQISSSAEALELSIEPTDANIEMVNNVHNPRLDELDFEKANLIDSMRQKINELRDQEAEIGDEIRINEDLGKKVCNMVENKATQSEFSKYELFIGELNKIVALLLSLTQRLHRYESMLQDLDMSNESDCLKKDGLVSKIEKLKSQHEEACYLRDVNDKRGDNVATFLEKYCTEEEFADFQYYVDMKSQLALMQSEIREKVKLGEERLRALQQTGSEWSYS